MQPVLEGEIGGDQWSTLLLDLFGAAVMAAQPASCLPGHLMTCLGEFPPMTDEGRLVLLGAGKAAPGMAGVAETILSDELGRWPKGVVTAPVGSPVVAQEIDQLDGSHPVPSDNSVAAARRTLAEAEKLTADDRVICLISGGASALWAAPIPPVDLPTKIELTRALLRSGASIAEMNVVRKHISQIKGGRLARAIAPARLMTLAISDVPGDDPASIGSGPTVGDASTQADARDILAKYKLPMPPAVDAVLADPKNLPVRPDDPAVAASAYIIAATADTALAAAAKVAEGAGLTVHNLGGKLEGEARDLARRHADFALSLQANGATGPQLILSGGETSVTVTGDGVGGRNGEYALAMHIALAGAPGIYGLACDTDGIDGMSELAGAMVTPDTAARAKVNGIDAVAGLANNDCYGFFGRVGGAIKTGPTGTNVNDFRAILVT